MYIKKSEIYSFGCFKEKTFEFKKGFNIIYGPNECGKSTLFAFIVFMFYGTKIKKTHGELSFKDRYMPWDGSAMGGRLLFETNGKEYSLERLHSTTKKTVSLHCITTGEEIRDRSILNAVGSHFFKVNANSLYNSSYISAESNAFTDIDELIDKLTNTAEDSPQDVSYKDMMGTIDEEILNISSSARKSALIPSLEKKLSEKGYELKKYKENLSNIEELSQKNIALNKRVSEIENKISDIKAQNLIIENDDSKPTKKPKLIVFLTLITISALICMLFLFNYLTIAVFAISFVAEVFIWLKKSAKKKEDISTKLFTLKQNNDRIIALTEEIGVIKGNIAGNESECNFLGISKQNYNTCVLEYEQLAKELSKAKNRLISLKLAREALSKAYYELKSVFSPKLSELSGNILSEITNGKYHNVLVSDTFEVNIDGKYGYKTAGSFSRGSNQQAYLAMRLALSRIILSDGVNVPLFLDDALAYYDNDRLHTTMEYLEQLSMERQVFFATCRKYETTINNDASDVLYL